MASSTRSISWTNSNEQQKMSSIYTFLIGGKYSDKDISCTITSSAMNIPRANSYTLKFPQSDTVSTTDIPDFVFTHDSDGNVVVS